jgi:DNA-binding transcriptional ArsR family regulator
VNTLSALADPTRARIVEALAERGHTVNEIVALCSLTQPAISRHLRVLREAGLVSVHPDGQRRVYRLDPRPLRELDRWLDRYRSLWAGRLDDLERHLDEERG